ncbi:MAG TPA: 23S rRNA (adenine(2503)-C(2))-methyltransferase RlmN [Candidatus Onthousia excrementipullorum]|uniref:Probable dual-specificity RNA methyltransferase RlmN n=1 Tax=Candidatus Onthousia excrementipullorum TaxID=2840884 RepID=A0A9D1J490_9FIRM|nr:23S rRNA (adenine(2503)-C(2))-methyltransferase RlmN [Candidatus Onthousia excrementipullorum]
MSIYDLTIDELTEYFLKIGEKKYYATELFSWLYNKRITSFSEATNIKKETREKLSKDFTISNIEIVTVEKAKDVRKYLFKLRDGEHIEAVLMNHDYGNSLCISSQVGCNMGCKFCESGRRKKVRNLTTGEMVEQILKVENESNLRISHVVIMGIGEPFDNYDNICNFIRIINHPKGLNIGARHITVSTCGLVPKILEFSEFPYQVNLAISLHAPNDKLRGEIMPIAKAYPLKELINAIKIYLEKTNRRVTFEYIMLAGINDSKENALELVHLLKGINCYVNLIPYNETEALQYKRSNPLTIAKFYDILKKNNITVTIRREFGGTISAACGQLRSKKEEI